MAERKVLNKYYPPDYDVSKIPRLRLPKNRQLPSRIMLPMSIQCQQCGEFIYKGKKFNARKEYCEGEDYLTIKRWRFYFRCPFCLHEITFKTDPKNSDYEVEHGATRNVEPWKVKRDIERRELEEKKALDEGDIMTKLENKSAQQQREMEIHEIIEELRDRNSRGSKFSTEQLLDIHVRRAEQREEQDDEAEARRAFEQHKEQIKSSAAPSQTSHTAASPMLDFELTGDTLNDKDDELKNNDVDNDNDDDDDDDDIDPDIRSKHQQLIADGLSFAPVQITSDPNIDVNTSSVGPPASRLSTSIVVKKRKEHTLEHKSKKQKGPISDRPLVALVPKAADTPKLSSLMSSYDSDSD